MCYTKQEIETITNNCKDILQLYKVCKSFKYLIDNRYLTKSLHLRMVTSLRFIKLNESKI